MTLEAPPDAQVCLENVKSVSVVCQRADHFKSVICERGIEFLTTEQGSVQAEGLWQVLDVSNPLVHGPGEVVGVIQAAQDDAGEVDGLGEVAH